MDMRSRRLFRLGLVVAAVIGLACEDEGGRPGEISFSVTIIPSTPISSSPSPESSKSASKPEEDEPEIVKVPGGAELTELPERAARLCNEGFPLKKACPSLVPVIKKDRSYLIDSFGRPGGRFQVLEMAAGAPGGDSSRNAPPEVAHLVVEVAKQSYLVPLGTPVETSTSLDDLLGQDRGGSLRVMPERNWKWNKPLLLAESFPGGGAHGDHLIYEWQKGARTYRVSLHAWTPGAEAVRTLQAIVKSIR